MYSEMVLYIEACESGSMFEGILADDINVYAITAANAEESSWGTYCYPDDMVNGVHINSCLGDLFSVNWMEDAEASDPSTESLDAQFEKVKNLTAKSHVMRYGDLDFKNEPVGNFYGNLDLPDTTSEELFFEKLFLKAKKAAVDQSLTAKRQHMTATSSRDIKLHHLYATVASKKSHKAQLDLSYEITQRMRVDHVFEQFKPEGLQAGETVLPRNFDCLKKLMKTYDQSCGKMDDYALQYVKYFVQVCETMTSNDVLTAAINKIKLTCGH